MGTIVARKRKDGSIGHTAMLRIKRAGKVIHSETKTFDRDQAAKAWLKKRETELAQPGALEKIEDPALADVIEQYNKEKQKVHGKTKTQVLQTIRDSDFAKLKCSEIGSPQVLEFLQTLDSQPQTRGNYLSHLASVFTVARPAWGYPLDKRAVDDARVVAVKLGIISRSKQRTRRPTLPELDKLLKHYTVYELKQAEPLPMRALILFALFSTRRQDEICRITAEDLAAEHSEITVRDMKNPGEKIGNDVVTVLTPEALALIEQRKVTKGVIWPYKAATVSTSFTRTCAILGIDDLHFHDLRHDGISRLFEMGWSIPRVATVSGHRSWQSLQRYSHLKQVGDKYEHWSWKLRMLEKEPPPKNAKAPSTR